MSGSVRRLVRSKSNFFMMFFSLAESYFSTMISEAEKEIIIRSATKFGAVAVFVFGSSLQSDLAQDIDIGVKGIVPRLFFKFYGELIKSLPKPVDVVDLSQESLFNRLVEEKGVRILG